MNVQDVVRRRALVWAAVLLSAPCPATMFGQVSPIVVVGVTPTCPYGIAACAPGAREGLGRLKGVRLVAQNPDRYNCTFDVQHEGRGLPDMEGWREQFKAVVGEAFIFRGVEITVSGTVTERSGTLALVADGLKQPLPLGPLEHKLQWNFRKNAPRQPEPDERDAYKHLVSKHREARPAPLTIEATGPLHLTDNRPILEVREFFMSTDP